MCFAKRLFISFISNVFQISSSIFCTLLETAKANGLNPETYLNHLLTMLPDRFAADPQASIDDLLPWAEEIQKIFSIVS